MVVPKDWPCRVKLMCCVEGPLGVRAKLTVGASNVNNDKPVPTVLPTVACRDSLRPNPGDSVEVVQPSVVADVHVVVPHSIRALIAIVGEYDLPAKFRPEIVTNVPPVVAPFEPRGRTAETMGALKEKNELNVPTLVETVTRTLLPLELCSMLSHMTVVPEVQLVVVHVSVVSMLAVGVLVEKKPKLRPEMVTDACVLGAALARPWPTSVITGPSKVNALRRVPTTADTVSSSDALEAGMPLSDEPVWSCAMHATYEFVVQVVEVFEKRSSKQTLVRTTLSHEHAPLTR